jgi:hypothetical protein
VAGLLANWACGPHASRWWSGEWSKRTHGRSLGQTAGFTFGFLGAICPDCGCLRTGYPRIPCLITIFPILQSQCDFCVSISFGQSADPRVKVPSRSTSDRLQAVSKVLGSSPGEMGMGWRSNGQQLQQFGFCGLCLLRGPSRNSTNIANAKGIMWYKWHGTNIISVTSLS